MKVTIRYTNKGFVEYDKIRKRFGWEWSITSVNRESTVNVRDEDLKTFYETARRGFLVIKKEQK